MKKLATSASFSLTNAGFPGANVRCIKRLLKPAVGAAPFTWDAFFQTANLSRNSLGVSLTSAILVTLRITSGSALACNASDLLVFVGSESPAEADDKSPCA